MEIEFDPLKRAQTLQERGLDFADAGELFDGPIATRPDTRRDYGEPRFQTLGLLDGHAVMVVWTPRGAVRRIISMRYAHEDEAQEFGLD
ncbi:MAG: BrnT family toxin [Rhodanobacteraceae bacterium]